MSRRVELENQRHNFSDQCFAVAQQFRTFNPVEVAQKLAERKEKDRHVSGVGANIEVQQRTFVSVAEQALDALEEEAKKVGRKGAFKGFRKILENGR